MSGWADPASPAGPSRGSGGAGGPVAWVAPEETPGLGVGQLIRGAWGLYRQAGRRSLLVAAVPALVQALLALPKRMLPGTTAFRMSRPAPASSERHR